MKKCLEALRSNPLKTTNGTLKNYRIIKAMHSYSYSYAIMNNFHSDDFKEWKNGWNCRQARHEEAHSLFICNDEKRRMAAIPAVFIDVTGD